VIKVGKDQMDQVRSIFDGIEDSMVTACLQGYQGTAWADRLPEPDFGFIISGEYSFFGGDPAYPGTEDVLKNIFDYMDGDESTAIYADFSTDWRDRLLEVFRGRAEEVMRYGIVQKDYVFDEARLQGFIDSLPEGYEIKPFDEELYHQAMSEAWSEEFCETFSSAEEYLEKGFGFAVMYEGEMVSGMSTMTVYDGGTEGQVATKESFRRRGLALPCAARFILECQRRGIRPCWDAANLTSRHMALKLGYEYRGEYSTVHMHR